MRINQSLYSLALAALMASVAPGVSHADSLVGGVTKTVNNLTGNIGKNNTVGNTVNNVTSGLTGGSLASTGKSNTAKDGNINVANVANVGLKQGKNSVSLQGKTTDSTLPARLTAKIGSADRKQLAKVCASLGGDNCATATRDQLKVFIGSKLPLLNNNQLASVCVSLSGSGCGSATTIRRPPVVDPGRNHGGSSTSGGTKQFATISGKANGGYDTQLTCKKILSASRKYEPDIVALCRAMMLQSSR